MSFNDLFEALKAFIIPFITRFEKLEREYNECAASLYCIAETVDKLANDQLDDRLTRLEDRLEDKSGFIYHVDDKLEDLDDRLKYELEGDNGLSARMDALESDVKRLEHSARHMEFDRIDSLEREVNALTDLVREQGEVIKALLKALEWEPPKD